MRWIELGIRICMNERWRPKILNTRRKKEEKTEKKTEIRNKMRCEQTRYAHESKCGAMDLIWWWWWWWCQRFGNGGDILNGLTFTAWDSFLDIIIVSTVCHTVVVRYILISPEIEILAINFLANTVNAYKHQRKYGINLFINSVFVVAVNAPNAVFAVWFLALCCYRFVCACVWSFRLWLITVRQFGLYCFGSCDSVRCCFFNDMYSIYSFHQFQRDFTSVQKPGKSHALSSLSLSRSCPINTIRSDSLYAKQCHNIYITEAKWKWQFANYTYTHTTTSTMHKQRHVCVFRISNVVIKCMGIFKFQFNKHTVSIKHFVYFVICKSILQPKCCVYGCYLFRYVLYPNIMTHVRAHTVCGFLLLLFSLPIQSIYSIL